MMNGGFEGGQDMFNPEEFEGETTFVLVLGQDSEV